MARPNRNDNASASSKRDRAVGRTVSFRLTPCSCPPRPRDRALRLRPLARQLDFARNLLTFKSAGKIGESANGLSVRGDDHVADNSSRRIRALQSGPLTRTAGKCSDDDHASWPILATRFVRLPLRCLCRGRYPPIMHKLGHDAVSMGNGETRSGTRSDGEKLAVFMRMTGPANPEAVLRNCLEFDAASVWITSTTSRRPAVRMRRSGEGLAQAKGISDCEYVLVQLTVRGRPRPRQPRRR